MRSYKFAIALLFSFVFIQNSFAMKNSLGLKKTSTHIDKKWPPCIDESWPTNGKWGINPKHKDKDNWRVRKDQNQRNSLLDSLPNLKKITLFQSPTKKNDRVICNKETPPGMPIWKEWYYLSWLNKYALAVGSDGLGKLVDTVRKGSGNIAVPPGLIKSLQDYGLADKKNWFPEDFASMIKKLNFTNLL